METAEAGNEEKKEEKEEEATYIKIVNLEWRKKSYADHHLSQSL